MAVGTYPPAPGVTYGTVTSQTAFGAAASDGSGTAVARANHTHGTPATPVTTLAATGSSTVNASTGAVTITSPAWSSTTPATIAYGGAGAVGTGTTIARSDHNHPMPDLSSTAGGALTFGGTGAAGVATTAARADHTHTVPAVTTTKTVRIPHTFTVPGDVLVPSGENYVVPPIFIPVPAGQTASIARVIYRINAGTSATFNVIRNGAGVTGLTGLIATTTPASTTQSQALAADDLLSIVITAVSGTPKNMTVTVFVDYTV